MKKIKILVFVLSISMFIVSCYTPRRGVVPCPHGKAVPEKTQNK